MTATTQIAAEYLAGSKLHFRDLWTHLGLERDKGLRWVPGEDTPEWVREYLRGYHTPSRAYPHSYAKALLTQKFAKVLVSMDPALAVRAGVARPD